MRSASPVRPRRPPPPSSSEPCRRRRRRSALTALADVAAAAASTGGRLPPFLLPRPGLSCCQRPLVGTRGTAGRGGRSASSPGQVWRALRSPTSKRDGGQAVRFLQQGASSQCPATQQATFPSDKWMKVISTSQSCLTPSPTGRCLDIRYQSAEQHSPRTYPPRTQNETPAFAGPSLLAALHFEGRCT